MAEVERELVIAYGSYVVGGGTDRLIESYHYVEEGYRASRIEFSFVITADDEVTFSSRCREAERAFRRINQTITISVKGRRLLRIGQRIGSGYDTHARIYKPNDPAQTARSRLYHVEINCSMQADTRDERSSGLRDAEVNLTHSPSRRKTVTISGQYTSWDSNKARATYDQNGDTFCNTVLASLGGTYEIIEEVATEDTYENELNFRRTYQEIIFNQGPTGLDDPEIVDQHLVLAPQWVGPGDSPIVQGGAGGSSTQQNVDRVINVNLGYNAFVDKDKTTNLQAKYNQLRPWLVNQAKIAVGPDAGSTALMSETVTYNPDDNSFTVSMQIQVVGKATWLQYRLSASDALQAGVHLVPIWNGDPFARYDFQGPATAIRTVEIGGVRVGLVNQSQISREMNGMVTARLGAAFDAKDLGTLTGASNWRLMEHTVNVSPLKRGRPGYQFDVTEVQATTTYQYFNKIQAGGTNAPSITPPTSGVISG